MTRDLFAGIVAGLWHTLLEMAPYLLFGFLVAGVLSVLVSPETVQRHLGRGTVLPVFKASLFGVPLPLCSCSVIPVATSLRKHGASRGATTAFLVSTPQTGVDSIFVTYSLLGLVFAVYRPVAALLSGLVAGLAVSRWDGDTDAKRAGDNGGNCSCHPSPTEDRLRQVFRHGFVTLPRDLAGPLLVGLVIAGVISAVVPEDFFAGRLGSGFGVKLVMLGVGIPLYVCATAAVPVAAALIGAGLSPGAALVFLMAGPGTNAATITTIWRFLGRRTMVIYLASMAICALLAGVLLDLVYDVTGTPVLPEPHHLLSHGMQVACAILLLAVLGGAMLASWRSRSAEPAASLQAG